MRVARTSGLNRATAASRGGGSLRQRGRLLEKTRSPDTRSQVLAEAWQRGSLYERDARCSAAPSSSRKPQHIISPKRGPPCASRSPLILTAITSTPPRSVHRRPRRRTTTYRGNAASMSSIVTEMVTGIASLAADPDRLRRALRSQEEVVHRGAAIECRLNAEDPKRKFQPSPPDRTLIVPGLWRAIDIHATPLHRAAVLRFDDRQRSSHRPAEPGDHAAALSKCASRHKPRFPPQESSPSACGRSHRHTFFERTFGPMRPCPRAI